MNRFIAIVIIAIIGFIALVTNPSHAQENEPFGVYYDSGNDLLENLRSTNSVDRLMGVAYIKGVSDASYGIYHCAPEHVTVGQARDIVQQHLLANAVTRHRPAAMHVGIALAKAFPCPSKGKNTL